MFVRDNRFLRFASGFGVVTQRVGLGLRLLQALVRP